MSALDKFFTAIKTLSTGGTTYPQRQNANLIPSAGLLVGMADNPSTASTDVTLSLGGTSTSSATAGAGSALPATPQGYLSITISGTAYKVPYYLP